MNAPTLPKIVNVACETQDNDVWAILGNVDTKGFDFARFIISMGVVDADVAVKPFVEECDTTGGTYTNITGATPPAITAAAGDERVYVIDIKLGGDRKRFLAVDPSAKAGDGAAGSAISIICLLYKAETRANTYADGGLTAAVDWVSV